MKKILYLIIVCLWVVGGLGSIGYAIYNGLWLIAIGCIVNGVLAIPVVVELFNELKE